MSFSLMIIEFIDMDETTDIAHNYSTICRRLLTKINQIQISYSPKNKINFDSICVSHIILNILTDSSSFLPILPSSEKNPVGKLGDMYVYVDFSIPRNHILFSFNKNTLRDSKIESIFVDDSDALQEVTLQVKSEFI